MRVPFRFILSSKIILILFIINSALYAQYSSTLKGVVTSESSDEVLPGANVVVVGTALGSATDIYGKYEIKNLTEGEITLRISYIGYKTRQVNVKIPRNKKIEMDFALESELLQGKEIIVTAQAKGQTEAINQQLTSNAIVNIVSSARIQEIPDANAAESVGRLPGVSVMRTGGEGNKVVIRGLAPKYNNVQVGGIKMASTESYDRSVDLSMISPYMLEGIEVTKAITPDMDADALGGTVNFKLREAQSGLRYDFLTQGGYNNLRNTYGDYKVVGSGSNRVFADQLGVFAQFDLEQRNRSANNMGAGYELNAPKIDQHNELFLTSLNLNDVYRTKQRYGGTLVLDYQIPSGSLILSNFASLSKSEVQNRSESYGIELSTHSYGTGESERKLNVAVNTLKYTQDLPWFSIESGLSHSFSEQKAPDNISFSFQESNGLNKCPRNISPYELPKFAVNNISKTFINDISRSNEYSREKEAVGSLNLKKGFSIFNKLALEIKTGAKLSYKDRYFDYNAKGGFLNYGSGQGARDAILNAFPWMKEQVPNGSLNMLYSLLIDNSYKPEEFLKGKYSLGPSANIGLMHQIIDVLEAYGNSEAYRYYDFTSNTNDYSGNEFYKAGFAMTDLRYSNFLQMIIGARYEEVTRKYKAVTGNSSVGIAQNLYLHSDTTSNVTHSNLLPIAHIKIKPVEWFDIRFAYTNTLSRPDFNTITPRFNIGTQAITWNNYELKPARSENFDLYLSFHENTIGLFTAGAFKKNIKDMIFASNGKILLDPSLIGMPADQKGKSLETYLNNEYPVDLWGLEFSWQTNFWYLPGLLSGIVLDINYTHINSEAKYPRTIVTSKFINQPPWIQQTETDTFYTSRMISQPDDIVNVSLGYDLKGFSIRGSLLFQSNIFIAANFWSEKREITDDFLRWDISVKQELPLAGFQVFCNVMNVTSAIDRNIIMGNSFPSSEQNYGMGIDFGIRYRVK